MNGRTKGYWYKAVKWGRVSAPVRNIPSVQRAIKRWPDTPGVVWTRYFKWAPAYSYSRCTSPSSTSSTP